MWGDMAYALGCGRPTIDKGWERTREISVPKIILPHVSRSTACLGKPFT